MEALNYLPCRADPDVWMRKVRKYNGTEYYEYMLLYVDDSLALNGSSCVTRSEELPFRRRARA